MIHAEVLLLSEAAQKSIKREVTELILEGQKLYITSDIWSSHGVHLFGGTMYWINKDWEIVERLLFAEPFHLEIHDAENIEGCAKRCMIELGFPANNPGAMVEMKINDHAGNIMNGMNAIQPDGKGCFPHKVELCVKRFIESHGIAPVVKKIKGCIAHLNRSTGVNGLVRHRRIQGKHGLPVRNPQSSSDTRWNGTYDGMEYCRLRQRAFQVYDIDATQCNVYNASKLDVSDWKINEQSVATLKIFAAVTTHAEGTKYPTLPLYFPLVFAMLDSTTDDAPLLHDFDELKEPAWKEKSTIVSEVFEARQALHVQVQERFIDDIEGTDTEKKLWVALILHPCFNHADFTSTENVSEEKKEWARQAARDRWEAGFKPVPAPVEPPVDAVGGSESGEPPAKKRRPSSSVFGLMRMAPPRATAPGRTEPVAAEDKVEEMDEMDQYLACPQEADSDGFDLLLWWKRKERVYPALSKMAKQILAGPISSAGAERAFSAAGRMHGDEQKGRTGDSLKAMLFAAFTPIGDE